jgi:hypothetical protein
VEYGLQDEDKRELLNAQPVDVLIIKKDMDSSNPPNIPDEADVRMVVKVTYVIADSGMDEGGTVCKLELLDKNNVITEYTAAGGAAYGIAQGLIAGDLIRYNKDGFGRIAKLDALGRVQGLEDAYYKGLNVQYGLVENIELNLFDYYENIMVDKLTLNLGNDGIQPVSIPVENGPAVYLYERSAAGWISPSATESIVAVNQGGTDASRVYVYTNDNNVVKALVIIK